MSSRSSELDAHLRPEALAARLPSWERVDYRPLLPAAAEIVRLSSGARREVVAAYAARYCDGPIDVSGCSKLYLLLRVLFDLPRALPRDRAAYFGGWVHPDVRVDGGPTFDVSWPVRIDLPARRMVIAPGYGYLGGHYAALLEYDWFATNFPLRSVDALSRLVAEGPWRGRP